MRRWVHTNMTKHTHTHYKNVMWLEYRVSFAFYRAHKWWLSYEWWKGRGMKGDRMVLQQKRNRNSDNMRSIWNIRFLLRKLRCALRSLNIEQLRNSCITSNVKFRFYCIKKDDLLTAMTLVLYFNFTFEQIIII